MAAAKFAAPHRPGHNVAPSNARDWSSVDLPVNADPPAYVQPSNTVLTPPAQPARVKVFPDTIGLDPTRDYPGYPASVTPREHPQAMDPVTGTVHTPLDTPPMTRVLGTGSADGLEFVASLGNRLHSVIRHSWTRYVSPAFPWVFPSVAGGPNVISPRMGYSRNTFSPTHHRRSARMMSLVVPIPAVNRNIRPGATGSQLTTRAPGFRNGRTTRGSWTGFGRPRGVVTEFPLVTPSYGILGQSRPLD